MRQLHVLQSGESNRVAVLFLHGAGLNAHQWDAQLKALAAEFHCIAPDLPEHGQSAAIGPLTLEGASEKVAQVLQVLTTDKIIHIVGHSFGATLGLHLLARQPERFATALLTGGSVGLSPMLAGISRLSASLTRFMSPEKLVRMSFEQFKIPDSEQPKFERDMRRSISPEFMKNLVMEMQSLTIPTTDKPVLALVGGDETLPAKQAARQIAHQLANAQAWAVPQVGHVWNLEQPDLFSKVVHDWVSHQKVHSPLRPLT